jgi:hypothetical protein
LAADNFIMTYARVRCVLVSGLMSAAMAVGTGATIGAFCESRYARTIAA